MQAWGAMNERSEKEDVSTTDFRPGAARMPGSADVSVHSLCLVSQSINQPNPHKAAHGHKATHGPGEAHPAPAPPHQGQQNPRRPSLRCLVSHRDARRHRGLSGRSLLAAPRSTPGLNPMR